MDALEAPRAQQQHLPGAATRVQERVQVQAREQVQAQWRMQEQ
jgi:hypothetical protein